MGFLLPICVSVIFTILLTTSQVDAKARAPDAPELRNALQQMANAGPDDDDDAPAPAPTPKSPFVPAFLQSTSRNLLTPWKFPPPPSPHIAGLHILLRNLLSAFKAAASPHYFLDPSEMPVLRKKHAATVNLYDLADPPQMPIVRNVPNMHKYRLGNRSDIPIMRNVPTAQKFNGADLAGEPRYDNLSPVPPETKFPLAELIEESVFDNRSPEPPETKFYPANLLGKSVSSNLSAGSPEMKFPGLVGEPISDNPSQKAPEMKLPIGNLGGSAAVKLPVADLLKEPDFDNVSQVSPELKFRATNPLEDTNSNNLPAASPEIKMSVAGESGSEKLSSVSPKVMIHVADPIGDATSTNLSQDPLDIKFRVTDVLGEFVADNPSTELPEMKAQSADDTSEITELRVMPSGLKPQSVDTSEVTALTGASSAFKSESADTSEVTALSGVSSALKPYSADTSESTALMGASSAIKSQSVETTEVTALSGVSSALKYPPNNPAEESVSTNLLMEQPEIKYGLANTTREFLSRQQEQESRKTKYKYLHHPSLKYLLQPSCLSPFHHKSCFTGQTGKDIDLQYGIVQPAGTSVSIKQSQESPAMKNPYQHSPFLTSLLQHNWLSSLYNQFGTITRPDSPPNTFGSIIAPPDRPPDMYDYLSRPSLISLLTSKWLSPQQQQYSTGAKQDFMTQESSRLVDRYLNGPSAMSFLTPKWLSSLQHQPSFADSTREDVQWQYGSPKGPSLMSFFTHRPVSALRHQSSLAMSTEDKAPLEYNQVNTSERALLDNLSTRLEPSVVVSTGENTLGEASLADLTEQSVSRNLSPGRKYRIIFRPSLKSCLTHSLLSLLQPMSGPITPCNNPLPNLYPQANPVQYAPLGKLWPNLKYGVVEPTGGYEYRTLSQDQLDTKVVGKE